MFTKLNLPPYSFRTKREGDKIYIFDDVRKKFLVLTPEEWVRQNFIRFLIKEKSFPSQLMAIESGLKINQNQFRADLLVYGRTGTALLVAEFKAPSVKITQEVFDQIARYNMKFRVNWLIVSNGLNHYCCRMNYEDCTYNFLKDIPVFGEIT